MGEHGSVLLFILLFILTALFEAGDEFFCVSLFVSLSILSLPYHVSININTCSHTYTYLSSPSNTMVNWNDAEML